MTNEIVFFVSLINISLINIELFFFQHDFKSVYNF